MLLIFLSILSSGEKKAWIQIPINLNCPDRFFELVFPRYHIVIHDFLPLGHTDLHAKTKSLDRFTDLDYDGDAKGITIPELVIPQRASWG